MMKRITWSLLPFLLAAGVAAGYVLRGTQSKTVTTTLVRLVTRDRSSPASHLLTADVTITGATNSNGSCQLPSIGITALPSDTDTWTLRTPGNGVTEGRVLAVSTAQRAIACGYFLVAFNTAPTHGFFVVEDETDGSQWGPFDAATLASHDWLLRLSYGNG